VRRAELLAPLTALLVGVVAADVLILLVGQSPAVVWRLLIAGTWGNAYGLGQVLYKATTLVFTGLAVAVGVRAGLFNIGAEGQLAAGGLAAAIAGLTLPASMPWLAAVLVCAGVAALAGALVGFVPGVLKARFGAHEVIVTIMLNFIVLAFVNWLLATHLQVPETLHTAPIRAGALPRLSTLASQLHGSAANASLVIALLLVLVVNWVLFRTVWGYELRATGLQPAAAAYGGVHVARLWAGALTVSGALAGLGGINFVLGYKGYYEEGFAAGSGYIGIAVALVARSQPIAIVPEALFFATLSQGGLAINALIPKQIIDVMQGVMILAMAVSVPEVQRLLLASHPKVADAMQRQELREVKS